MRPQKYQRLYFSLGRDCKRKLSNLETYQGGHHLLLGMDPLWADAGSVGYIHPVCDCQHAHRPCSSRPCRAPRPPGAEVSPGLTTLGFSWKEAYPGTSRDGNVLMLFNIGLTNQRIYCLTWFLNFSASNSHS